MRNSILICILVVYSSCLESMRRVPKNIILPDRMSDILVDVSLAESFTEAYLMKDSSLKKDSVLKSEISKALVLDKVDIESFTRSYSYYTSNPNLFKEIMDSANLRANRRRDKMYSTPYAPPKKPANPK